jgi:hypothetical protein
MTSVTDIANEVAVIDEQVLKYMPFVFGMLKFTPVGGEAALAQPLVTMLLTALDNAAKAVATGNAGSAIDVVAEVTKHLTQGLPNSPVLSSTIAGEPDASRLGSG